MSAALGGRVAQFDHPSWHSMCSGSPKLGQFSVLESCLNPWQPAEFFPCGTFWDILGHLRALRPNTAQFLAAEAYDPVGECQIGSDGSPRREQGKIRRLSAPVVRFAAFSRHGSFGMLHVMKPPVYVDVDPRTLRLPWSRRDGADPAKLARQISRHGISTKGMPPPFVYRATDGELVLSDGVTRATRVAKFLPGSLIRVEVIGDLGVPGATMPTVGDKLP
jgi:hypothetical protein